MYGRYLLNNRTFEISVLGDINEKTSKISQEQNLLKGDGVLNQIELTRNIRSIVSEDWLIAEKTERLSADVNCDGQITRKRCK